MLISAILIVAFIALGLPILMLRQSLCDVLLAPAFGLAACVLIAYSISANFDFSGADSMAGALAILLAFGICVAVKRRSKLRELMVEARESAKLAPLIILPAVLMLIPAMFFGIENFFGAVNFDFFFNSQDSLYLATHSIHDFAEGAGTILPFNWSANPQGRFAISLIGAFASKFLDWNPLHFNAALLSSLIVTAALAFAVVVRNFYRFGALLTGMAVTVTILSGNFAQGYAYFLLGQISAFPLFFAVCVYASRVLTVASETEGGDHRSRGDAIVLIFLLNALYVFYPILCIFAIAIIVGAFVLLGMTDRNNAVKNTYELIFVIAGSLIFFLSIRIFSLGETKRSIIDWIVLSLKTAAPGTGVPPVFGEYTTEGFVSLLFGFFSYPINNSKFGGFLHTGLGGNLELVVIAAVILLTFFWALTKVVRSHSMSVSAKAIIGSISMIALVSSSIFFATRSGYAIFKIGNWLIPFLLPVFLAAICFSIKKIKIYDIPFVGLSILILIANLVAGASYISSFLSLSGRIGVENVGNINGMIGVDQLKKALSSTGDAPILLNFRNGLKNAWLANEFRGRETAALAQNFQPLDDRLFRTPPCSGDMPSFPKNAILISDQGAEADPDIVSINRYPVPFFENSLYAAYSVSKIEHYAFFGRGTYPIENLSPEQVMRSGFPKRFRWVERGAELFIYTQKASSGDIEFSAIPGYVNGPAQRSLQLNNNGDVRVATFTKKDTKVDIRGLALKRGMNCVYIESKDEVRPLPRYGAWIRPDISLDLRFLNFALSDIQINIPMAENP